MLSAEKGQRTPRVLPPASPLTREVQAFLVDRQARGLSPQTVGFYRKKLGLFLASMEAQGAQTVEQVTPERLRLFLLHEAEGRTPGGVHSLYRSVRAFLRWWEEETEPEGWRDPIGKVAARPRRGTGAREPRRAPRHARHVRTPDVLGRPGPRPPPRSSRYRLPRLGVSCVEPRRPVPQDRHSHRVPEQEWEAAHGLRRAQDPPGACPVHSSSARRTRWRASMDDPKRSETALQRVGVSLAAQAEAC
jgi:hypothetical protein